MKRLTGLLLAALALTTLARADEPKVLVYTRNFVTNGQGLRPRQHREQRRGHPEDGRRERFAVDVSDDPGVFTPANLKQYRAIIFSNSNNEAFANDAQRDAFRRYIHARRRVRRHPLGLRQRARVAVFWSVLGGKFLRHPKFQKFTVRVQDASHPATKDLPATFEWEDECYFHRIPQSRPAPAAGDRSRRSSTIPAARSTPTISRRRDAAGLVPERRRRPRLLHGPGPQEGALREPAPVPAHPRRHPLGDGRPTKTRTAAKYVSTSLPTGSSHERPRSSSASSRRHFLKTAMGAGASARRLPDHRARTVFGRSAPSNLIHVAQIGCGRIGRDLRDAGRPEAQRHRPLRRRLRPRHRPPRRRQGDDRELLREEVRQGQVRERQDVRRLPRDARRTRASTRSASARPTTGTRSRPSRRRSPARTSTSRSRPR